MLVRKEFPKNKLGFPYIEYKPEKAEKGLPLIVFLHGAGERDDGRGLPLAEKHGFHKIFGQKDYEFVYLIPQIPRGTFWGARQETLTAFIKKAIKKYDIDEKRVYLTGLSMGGIGTWCTALSEPELFSAIVPMCGIGYEWMASTLNMPIWVFHGDQDTAVPVEHSDKMVEALRKAGKNVRYTRYEGVGHNCWDYACNEETLEWLLSQVKE